MRPLAYIVCTSPRAGSTLLCQGLAHTDRAGAPAEFFDHRPDVEGHWRRRYGIASDIDYVAGLIAATSSANGVFGTKLHWTTLLDMHRALRVSLACGSAVRPGGSLNDLLLRRFSIVRYIWLRRRNKVAQGISHFKASRTDTWERPAGQPRDVLSGRQSVDFDLRSIDHCVKWAHIYDDEWAAYFQRRDLSPMQLFYEDLSSAYDKSIRAVLGFLDIPYVDLPDAVPPLERLADETSLEWERCYRALRS
ncbi:MAG TPA: Stf0 family sulfotransferase [Acidimicrobiales bacterium]|nr:Stf0 family sulfotransferase [Acidimicrobiales bacterium]